MPKPSAAVEGAPNPRRLLASAAGGIFMFGVVMALLGATLLPLAARLELDAARAGNIFLVMNFGIFLALAASGPSLDRFGTRPVLLACSLLLAAGLLALARASSLWEVAAGAWLAGLGGGGLNTGANALVSDAFPENRGPALNLLGVFFGFGAIALPFVIGSISERFSLGQILGVSAILPLACAAAYALLSFPPAREARGFRLVEAAGVARNRRVLLFAALLFFQSGNEFTMGGWLSTFMAREIGAGLGLALYTVTGFWAAIMAGRLVSARLLRRIQAEHLVVACGAASALSTGLLLAAESGLAASAAAAAIGFAYAPIYPTTLGMAADRFPRFAGTMFSVIFSIALLGGMTFPWAAGQLAQGAGYRAVLAMPLLGAAGVTALALVILRRA